MLNVYLKYWDSIISNSRNESTSLQNNLLNILNKYSQEHSFKIITFKEPHLGVTPDSTHITSFQFTLEGKYKDLESVLYKLENEHSLGSLSHISFEKKKDYRLNNFFLQCSVIVQNVEWNTQIGFVNMFFLFWRFQADAMHGIICSARRED